MIARRLSSRTRIVAVLVTLIVVAPGTSAAAEDDPDPRNVTPPTVTGLAQWGENLTADPGTWDPADTPLAYQWMRHGAPVAGATGTSYRIDETADLSKVFSVRVHPVGRPDLAVESAATQPAARAKFENTTRPSIWGTLKYRRTLTAKQGAWSRDALTFRYQWFSAGKPVKGATHQRFTLRPGDVGHTIRVEVTATRAGFETRKVTSRSTGHVQHLTAVRKTVTYSVRTRGKVTQNLTTFKKLAQETLDDPRGWRANGIRFKRVPSGGSFTLVLSEASKVPSYSSGCSSNWSCRAGRYVIINQNRWRSATPSWNKARGSLRDYRNMVVNHEVGHWLGRGHAPCSKRGSAAPVMQQQSKSLQGCKFNPWPKASELYSPRYRF